MQQFKRDHLGLTFEDRQLIEEAFIKSELSQEDETALMRSTNVSQFRDLKRARYMWRIKPMVDRIKAKPEKSNEDIAELLFTLLEEPYSS